MRARVRRVGHVGLAVTDLDRSVAFYTGALGMRLTERFSYPADTGHGTTVAAAAFIRCDATHHQLALFQPREDVAGGPAPLGLHHLAFEMATPADLLAMLASLREGGVEIVNGRKGGPGNQPRFYARDPDGYLLEFYWGLDDVGWDGLPRASEPIQEIDLERFDFDAFVAEREDAGARVRARAGWADPV